MPRTELRSSGEGKVYANLRKTDIRAALQMISEEGQLNILASPNVQGEVYANLNGVEILEALHAILRATGFSYRKDGAMIFVGTPEELQQMEFADQRIGMRVYRPDYVSAEELQILIGPMLTEAVGQASVGAPPTASTSAISRLSSSSRASPCWPRGCRCHTTG